MSQYIPIPPNKEDPAAYAFAELQDLARSLEEAKESVPFQILNAAPAKPRDGMVAYADGTNWDPGAGEGVYAFINNGWVALHTGGTGSGANLSWTASTRTIASDTGSDAVISLFTNTDAGLVPASGGGTANFLRADGTFAAPPGGGASALNDLTDVTITTPSNGQVLKYNGSAWINDTDATGGGGTGNAYFPGGW